MIINKRMSQSHVFSKYLTEPTKASLFKEPSKDSKASPTVTYGQAKKGNQDLHKPQQLRDSGKKAFDLYSKLQVSQSQSQSPMGYNQDLGMRFCSPEKPYDTPTFSEKIRSAKNIYQQPQQQNFNSNGLQSMDTPQFSSLLQEPNSQITYKIYDFPQTFSAKLQEKIPTHSSLEGIVSPEKLEETQTQKDKAIKLLNGRVNALESLVKSYGENTLFQPLKSEAQNEGQKLEVEKKRHHYPHRQLERAKSSGNELDYFEKFRKPKKLEECRSKEDRDQYIIQMSKKPRRQFLRDKNKPRLQQTQSYEFTENPFGGDFDNQYKEFLDSRRLPSPPTFYTSIKDLRILAFTLYELFSVKLPHVIINQDDQSVHFKLEQYQGQFDIHFEYTGRLYFGHWKESKGSKGYREGNGVDIIPNSYVYHGLFHKDRRDGYGVMHSANGDFYKGYWRNNQLCLQNGAKRASNKQSRIIKQLKESRAELGLLGKQAVSTFFQCSQQQNPRRFRFQPRSEKISGQIAGVHRLLIRNPNPLSRGYSLKQSREDLGSILRPQSNLDKIQSRFNSGSFQGRLNNPRPSSRQQEIKIQGELMSSREKKAGIAEYGINYYPAKAGRVQSKNHYLSPEAKPKYIQGRKL